MSLAEVFLKGYLGAFVESHELHAGIWLAGFALCAVIGYLLGSINTAVIISKNKYHDDIRNHGSGNAGMTNMLRTYGKAAAAFTLLGDAAKTALAIVVATAVNGRQCAYLAAFFCIIGHVYPLYSKFKGGKGVVVTAMTVLMLDPIVFLILFVIFVAIVAWTKYVSLGSIMCVLLYPLVLYNIQKITQGYPDLGVAVAVLTALFVVWLHRGNIERLREGRENKISFKKKK